MLSRMRTVFAQSWLARGLALVLALSFGAWGIQGALLGGGVGAENVARVDGRPITAQAFDRAYRGELARAAERLGAQQGTPVDPATIPPPMRRGIAQATLAQLVDDAAVVAQGRHLGLSVPDEAIRQAVFGIPQFKGPDGKFDRARFDAVLSQNNLTEARLLDLVRDQLMTEAVLSPIQAAATVPAPMFHLLYDYGAEQRRVQLVEVPFAVMPAPPAPDAATLHRFYLNHPKAFAVPELRRIRVVLLSRQTVARDVQVPDAQVTAAFDAQRARLIKPERRSIRVAVLTDRAKAAAIATFWKGGAGWPSVQAMAAKDGGSTVSLDHSAQIEIPSATLGKAVFAAAPGTVSGPVEGDQGWNVFEVTDVQAPSGDVASAREQVREQLAEQRAATTIQDRVDRLQDAIAGGGLDRIPAGLGAVAAEGTLDAQGDTAAGEPAPLPGTEAIRRAIVARAFAQKPGAAAQLEPGPEGSYFALEVLGVTPASERDEAAARADVARLWRQDAIRREADERATAIYVAARAARALGPAASQAGLAVMNPAPFRRLGAGSVPPSLTTVAFGLAIGDAAMVETATGFDVAVLVAVLHPPPGAGDPGAARLREELQRSLADDLETGYARDLTRRAAPRIDAATVDRIIGQ